VLWLLAHSFQALIINFGSQSLNDDDVRWKKLWAAGSFSFVPFGFFFLLPNEENEREPAEKDFGFYHRSLAKFQHSLAE